MNFSESIFSTPAPAYFSVQCEPQSASELLGVLNKHRQFLSQAFEPEKKKLGEEKQKLSIIKEVPAFVGPDMKEYGPFSGGQSVELPWKTAELLIQKKLALMKPVIL